MNRAGTRISLPDSPFPGINPFSYADRNVFFARQAESRNLIRLIVIHRGALLYSDSGTGKSSLINAGLIPAAIAEGLQPERIRVQPRQGEEFIVERLSTDRRSEPPYLPSMFAGDDGRDRTVLSVDDFMAVIRKDARETRPLLIFDQFEEWITLFEERGKRRSGGQAKIVQKRIEDAIVALLAEKSLSVKILLVLREDYLAKFTPLFNRYPNLPDQYLRLTSLPTSELPEIIRGPFSTYPDKYTVEIPDRLAMRISKEFQSRSADTAIRLTEVQIVCRYLTDSGVESVKLEQYFDKQGGVQGILEQYLESALDELPERQRGPAVGLLSKMVTSAGTRNVISDEDVISLLESEDGLPPSLLKETLESLESKSKLVRREHRRGIYFYEITSEFLISWIQRKAKERSERRRIEESEKALAEERKKAEAQAKIARRFRRFAIAMALFSIAVIGLLIWIFQKEDTINNLQKSQADMEEKLALTQKRIERAQARADSSARARIEYAQERARAKIDSAKEASDSLASAAGQKVRLAQQKVETLNASARASKERSNLLFRLSVERALTIQAPALSASSLPGMDTLAVLLAYQGYAFHNENLQRMATLGKDNSAKITPALDPAIDNKQYRSLLRSLNALPGEDRAGPIVFRDPSRIRCVVYSPVDRSFVFGTDEGRILLKRENSGSLKVLGQLRSSIRALSFEPDGGTLATGDNSEVIQLWDLTGVATKTRTLEGHSDRVLTLAFHPSGNYLASGGGDHSVRLWNIAEGSSRVLISLSSAVRSVRFDQSGETLFAAASDGEIMMLSATNDYHRTNSLTVDRPPIHSFDIDPASNLAAVAGEGATIELWDLKSGQKVGSKQSQSQGVTAVRFSRDGKLLAAAGFDGSLRLWNMADGSSGPIVLSDAETGTGVHDRATWALDFSQNGDRLVSVSDEIVEIWLTRTSELYTLAENALLRNLTREEWNKYIGDVDIPYSEGHHPVKWSTAK